MGSLKDEDGRWAAHDPEAALGPHQQSMVFEDHVHDLILRFVEA